MTFSNREKFSLRYPGVTGAQPFSSRIYRSHKPEFNESYLNHGTGEMLRLLTFS